MPSIQAPTLNGSVIAQPQPFAAASVGPGDYAPLYFIASAADGVQSWGYNPRMRDQQLREFWPTEFFLASALGAMATRYSNMSWTLEGPPKVVRHYQDVLQGSDFGAGWMSMMHKVCTDLLSQDNGAFIEIVRTSDDPAAPVVSLNHLDSGRCVRTGRPATPVIYTDLYGVFHQLKWYQVATLCDMPAPIERMRGMQYCAVTRMLRFCQIMRDVAILKHEKVSGRFTRKITLVSGVQTKAINDAIEQNSLAAEGAGLTRFVKHAVLAALDPNSTVSVASVDLASMPDDWNEDVSMRWYITGLALAFGTDYQDFAPLPGRGIGSGNEAKIAHLKSRGKGPATYAELMQHLFNFSGILPRSISFKMGETDVAAQQEQIAMHKERALEREIMIRSGQITTQVARQMAVDSGDLDPRYLEFMHEQDATGESQVNDSEVPASETPPAYLGDPGPSAPPPTQSSFGSAPSAGGGSSGGGSATAPAGPRKPTTAPANNNAMRTKPPSQSQKKVPVA